MNSFELSKIPLVQDISNELENYFNLKWNIGVHMIVYRDGSDMMGWHADDTQGEKIIVCVVLHPPVKDCVKIWRPLLIKPKGQKDNFHVGDEMIWVYESQGDAYIMDGVCIVNTFCHL